MATSVTENRLKILENLYFALGVSFPAATTEGVALEDLESNSIPTIGAEIEVTWKSVMPDHSHWFNEPFNKFSVEKLEAFNERCNELDSKLKPLYLATVEAGIPDGKKSCKEGYHEFSHKPKNWYETLGAEIEILMNAGLIPIQQNLPFHITLGGLGFDKNAGIAACIVQLTGGSSAERLAEPQGGRKMAWACKGTSGIKGRISQEMEGRYKKGLELRTLIANTPEQVKRTLQSAQVLGAAIMAQNKKDQRNPLEKELALCWEEVKNRTIRDVLAPNNLNKWWDSPLYNKSQWKTFSELYGKKETEAFIGSVGVAVDYMESEIKRHYAAKF